MKKELWLRLHHYRFHDLVPADLSDRVASVFGSTDASTHAFAAKVARKQRWTTSFALRAVAEYKKFVYLGNVATFRVTPPKVIDAVWHEHLLFSRAYRDFCREVVGRDFDHNPELLPAHKQTDVFQAQYAATLALYRAEFNVAPPADVWGTPKFGKSERTAEEVIAPARSLDATAGATAADDIPLFMRFQEYDSSGSPPSGEWAFSDGGGFTGGGGGNEWTGGGGDGTSSDASGTSDGASGDSGDSGSSCSGGSGCSSSCSSSD